MKRHCLAQVSFIPAVILMMIAWVVVEAAENRGGNLFGYVGTSTDDDLVVFDLSTNTVVPPTIDLLPEGDYPYDVTLNGDGSEVWIAGASGEGVVVVETTNNTVVERIPNLGNYPVDVIFNQDGSLAYVSNRDTADDIAIVDTSTYTSVGTVVVPNYYLGPGKMALNHCNGDLYVVNWFDDRFFVVDAASQTVTTDMVLGVS